jgi:hypothetical protein
MSKAWRNPRQIIVHQAPAEPEDAQRLERVVSLLAIGVERLLSEENQNTPEPLDFHEEVSLNTCRDEETPRR